MLIIQHPGQRRKPRVVGGPAAPSLGLPLGLVLKTDWTL